MRVLVEMIAKALVDNPDQVKTWSRSRSWPPSSGTLSSTRE